MDPAASPSTAPDPVSSANHKPFVPHIPRKNNKKRSRMRGAIADHGPRKQSNQHQTTSPSSGHHNTFRKDNMDHDDRPSTNPARSHESAEKVPKRKNNTWHRQQTIPLHGTTTAELDDTWAKGHLHSKAEDTSRNGRQFNDPSGSRYSFPHHDSFQSQRNSCYSLWKQLDAAYDARERHLCMKEEDLARREQAVRTQEQLLTHWMAQAQAERLEVAYIKRQAIMLKEQMDAERSTFEAEAKGLETTGPDMEPMCNHIDSARVPNESGEDVDKISEIGRTLHVKMDPSQMDYHYPERIAGQSGEDTNMGEILQNCHSMMENDAGESFEAMRGSSQGCVDISELQAKLDISVKAPICSMETIELCEFSSSKVTSYVSEEGNDPEKQHRVSNEIVNRALESPAIFASNRAVIGDSEHFPSETDKVDVCKNDLRIASKVNDKDSSLQHSSLNKEEDKMCQLPAFQSLLCADKLKPEEIEVHLNNTESSLPTPRVATFPIKVKVENVECERETPVILVGDNLPTVSLQTLKVKSEAFEDCETDELDHISLHLRQKLCKTMLADMEQPKIDILKGGYDSEEAQKPKEIIFSVKRNKKKTKICSVETALEEDAPGLLQVLREKGFMDEIKLYGDLVNGNLLGLAAEEDNFKELENVIDKLWGRPSGLVKMGRMRQIGANKPTYCLACLLSLIEQTRSLQLRKWPVEWGWCRQLQSFIFVFERHNRIVLERPEYGYATYFFELVQSLPIKWQVGRLVTVMSVAICSRTALLENKPLEIGEDLSSEEASILEDYGWTPNSGFGSLLNYCDRVVHDRKVDDDDMEWRSKIGKLLMAGHAHGSISITNIPKKLQHIVPTVKYEEY